MPEWNIKPVQIGGFKYAHINALGATVLMNAIGHLHAVIINTAGAGGNTCILSDSVGAAAPVIAVIDTVVTTPTTLTYNTTFRSGLTVILAAGTAADITVIYS